VPTRTFFNLPDEKRKKLIDAIHGEFSRVPFDEVSINQIIRLASIPRGSFYQYFEDKRDMLQYLLSDYRTTLQHRALESLKRNGGDLFRMFLDILDFTYAFVTEERNNTFFGNVFSDIRVNFDFLRQQVDGSTFAGFTAEALSFIDKDALDIRSEDDFGNMLGILLSLTGEAFATAFFDISNYEHVRSRYVARLELLKRGFLKAEG
jgi:AcrR family transcriptional regulator